MYFFFLFFLSLFYKKEQRKKKKKQRKERERKNFNKKSNLKINSQNKNFSTVYYKMPIIQQRSTLTNQLRLAGSFLGAFSHTNYYRR